LASGERTMSHGLVLAVVGGHFDIGGVM
jgi:hypothetical protein